MPCVWLKLDLEDIVRISNVALQDQEILGFLRFLAAKDGTILQRKLVGGEIVGLKEDQLILVAGVQLTLGIAEK